MSAVTTELAHRDAMQAERAKRSAEIAEDNQFALADMPQERFEALKKRMEIGLSRSRELLTTALIEGAHYGNPEQKNGRTAFNKPVLYQSGARELRRVFRLQVRKTDVPDQIIQTPELVSVTVERCIVDSYGNILDRCTRACTSREKRFKSFSKDREWTYDDPREVLNDCLAMAEKRAGNALTVSATGMEAVLAAGEEVDEALQDRAIVPWTEAEKKAAYHLATQKGLGKTAFSELVLRVLGRGDVGTGVDVQKIMAALEAVTVEPKEDGDA